MLSANSERGCGVGRWIISGGGWKQKMPSGHQSSGNHSLENKTMLVTKIRLSSSDSFFFHCSDKKISNPHHFNY